VDDTRLEEVKELLSEAITESRDLSHLLRPSTLDELGLAPALRELVENYKGTTEIDFKTSLSLEGDIEVEEKRAILYRAAQELLNNAVKHGNPEEIKVGLSGNGDEVKLSIEDDGEGFDPDRVVKESGLGLKGIRENANIAGGEFQLNSKKGEGTRAEIVLPLD